MTQNKWIMIAGFAAAIWVGGCREDAPPPPRVPVPTASNRDAVRESDFVKPMPPEDWREARQPASAGQK